MLSRIHHPARQVVRSTTQTQTGICPLLLRALLLPVVLALASSSGAAAAQAESDPIPALAYYYIWFDPTSWERAKSDYPLLGCYASDDRLVMERHIEWAQQVGIDGFIVSWKSTPALNRRLEQLIEVAAARDFKLAIIYQGLDFARESRPVDQIAADLKYFTVRWANHPVFDIFGRPLVIWSGTWEYDVDEIASIAESNNDRLLLLASERSVEGIARLAGTVDGNAYYWSSVNPDTFPGYPGKLVEMGEAVHATGGIWIAPAAPGYDSRPLGGERVVDRQGGEMFRKQLAGAMAANPDAIGLISWNEFSENTHIELSENYRDRELQTLATILGATAPTIPSFDSNSPSGRGAPIGLLAIGAMTVLFATSTAMVLWRRNGSGKRESSAG